MSQAASGPQQGAEASNRASDRGWSSCAQHRRRCAIGCRNRFYRQPFDLIRDGNKSTSVSNSKSLLQYQPTLAPRLRILGAVRPRPASPRRWPRSRCALAFSAYEGVLVAFLKAQRRVLASRTIEPYRLHGVSSVVLCEFYAALSFRPCSRRPVSARGFCHKARNVLREQAARYPNGALAKQLAALEAERRRVRLLTALTAGIGAFARHRIQAGHESASQPSIARHPTRARGGVNDTWARRR